MQELPTTIISYNLNQHMESIINSELLFSLGIKFAQFFIGVLLLFILQQIIIYWYRKSKNINKIESDNFIFGIKNIFKAILGLVTIVFIFSLFGIDLKSLLTSLSIVAAAFVILFKEYISDFLSGIYLGFSKDFEIGDYIQINDMKGKVIELRLFKTKMLNDDDVVVSLPNSKIYLSDLINYTKRDMRLLSVDFQLGIEKIKSLEILQEELVKALDDYIEFLEADSFNLKIVKIDKDAMDIKFQYSLKEFNQEKMKEIRRKTVRCIFSYISKV